MTSRLATQYTGRHRCVAPLVISKVRLQMTSRHCAIAALILFLMSCSRSGFGDRGPATIPKHSMKELLQILGSNPSPIKAIHARQPPMLETRSTSGNSDPTGYVIDLEDGRSYFLVDPPFDAIKKLAGITKTTGLITVTQE